MFRINPDKRAQDRQANRGLYLDWMQANGVCAEVSSVAVEASGTGWGARLIPPSSSNQYEREFETVCRIAQAKFNLVRQR